jgi:hypothetical protein
MPRQQGVVLLVMLALLFIATLLGIAMVVSTTGETRMASLRSQREFSHTLAEAGASAVALKSLNDLDPDKGLSDQTWDCTNLNWQGGLGTTTQPGTCQLSLDANKKVLKVQSGISDIMNNQLRAQAAVVPLLSGIGPIIGAPGRAGFVVAAATVSPDPGAAAITGAAPQSSWLQRNGGWYWPVATSAGGGQTPPDSSTPTTTTQPFALKAIPTPSNLPDQPWTTYSWTDYKRGLGSDSVAGLKTRAGIVPGIVVDPNQSYTVSQLYQYLKDNYKNYTVSKDNYGRMANIAMIVALIVDAQGKAQELISSAISTITNLGSAVGTASGAGAPIAAALQAANTALGAVNQASGAFTDTMVDSLVSAMDGLGRENIKAAVAVIEARKSIRSAWNETPDEFANEEGGKQAVWQCGDDDAQRDEPDPKGVLQKTPDTQFKDDTAEALKNPPSDSSTTSLINGIVHLLGGVVGGDNVKKVNEKMTLLGGIADGSEQDQGQDALPQDPIGSEIQPGWEDKIEPKFMLVQGNGGGFIQTNPMCKPDAELIIQANTGAPAPTPGNEPKVVNATIVHTGPITFKAEAPLYDDPKTLFVVEKRVTDILVSNGKITVDSGQQGQSGTDGTTTTSGHAGMILWADSDIAINRPVEGAAVAGGTVTVATQSQNSGTTQNAQMLTYNPAVDPGLLGNGKFPLAGYTLGSWTSLASTP